MTGRVIDGAPAASTPVAPPSAPAPAPSAADVPASAPRRLLTRRPRLVTALALALTVGAYALLVWQHRWISDDGLIFLRTVRQVLEGHGPVFNVGERVEANTSTLWTVVLLALMALPVRPEFLAVGAGMVLSVAAVALGLDAARRLTGRGRIVVPAGGLVLLGVPPFWDFGTSGLETGLTFCWLAGGWRMLVRRSQTPARWEVAAGTRGRAWPLAVLLGLGPLVRPDLAVVSAVALVALVVLEAPRGRRGWTRVAGLAAAAAALPVAYEVFRAGFYGLLVPAAALAKEAAEPRWGRGFTYLRDTAGVYWLAVPALALAVAAAALLRPRLRRADRLRELVAGTPRRRARAWDRAGTVAVALTPVVGGTMMGLYVVRVGGDFMHARMLLPAIFCLLLPVLALPLRRATVVPLAVVLVWAMVSGAHLRPHDIGINAAGIADERAFYLALLGTPHPLTADDYRMHPYVQGGVRLLDASPVPVLALQARGRGPSGPEWEIVPLAPVRRAGWCGSTSAPPGLSRRSTCASWTPSGWPTRSPPTPRPSPTAVSGTTRTCRTPGWSPRAVACRPTSGPSAARMSPPRRGRCSARRCASSMPRCTRR